MTLLELAYEDCPVSMIIAMEKSGNPILELDDTIN